MAELEEMSVQNAADVVTRHSLSPSTLALSVAASSAPVVEQSLLLVLYYIMEKITINSMINQYISLQDKCI